MADFLDLDGAQSILDEANATVDQLAKRLAASAAPDDDQVLAFELAHRASELAAASALVRVARNDASLAGLSLVATAEAVAALATATFGRETTWEVTPPSIEDLVSAWRDPARVAALASVVPAFGLDDELVMARDTFRRFAAQEISPVAEHIHRHNADVPESIISGLAEMGVFGLSIPERYGGSAGEGSTGIMAMVLATEELSRASLGAGGSLITRPEILARALEVGGTSDQKQQWLPRLASGEVMAAVAVTEPDFGSDVAGLSLMASEAAEGGWSLSGTKTWCTFAARADVLMVLARTEADRSLGHRGLSLFIVPKARADGEGFVLTQPGGGRIEGRPIDTIGYRGMHSYELSFDGWVVDAEHLIGGNDGLGRGFYFQMAGFENGRLQTAARAIGVMQAAYDEARRYATERRVFGAALGDYQLTQVKLTEMATRIAASRAFTYHVAELLAAGEGSMEASMAKAYACRAAEWVTREAMQIHGGMGYAEEYSVSRYFVDARVLSIFEGTEEVLCLKVIARQLAQASSSV